MVYLTARFDGSENVQANKPHIYTVAGWIAEVRDWRMLRKQWDGLLRSYGLSYFHMTDFIGGYKEFAEWPEDEVERQRRYREFCRLIKKHKLHGFASAINKTDFDDVVTPELRARGFGRRYYGFNVIRILEDIEEWIAKQNYRDSVSVHYVFADAKTDKVLTDIAWLFRLLSEDSELTERFKIGEEPYSVGIMRRDARLQPSDILACLSNRHAVRFAIEGPDQSVETERYLDILGEYTAGNDRLWPMLYNNKRTLLAWIQRLSHVGELIGPQAPEF